MLTGHLVLAAATVEYLALRAQSTDQQRRSRQLFQPDNSSLRNNILWTVHFTALILLLFYGVFKGIFSETITDFLILLIFIEILGWHWLWVSGIQSYDTSSVYCIVCSPPKVKAPSVSHPLSPLDPLLPPPPPFPPGNHHTVLCLWVLLKWRKQKRLKLRPFACRCSSKKGRLNGCSISFFLSKDLSPT